MPNRYTQLLEANIPNEIFVRRALGLLETDLREMALLSLQQWAETDIVAESLFKPIAMMVRPTWGTWNNLLIELRNLRSDTLQTADAKTREKVQQKRALKSILNYLHQSLDLEAIESWLTPLYKQLTPQKMPRDFSLQQLLALPITLRNHISHGNPTNADYWDDLATHFRPLLQWLSQQKTYLQLCQSAPHNTPWFITSDTGLLTYNGIHNKDISYTTNEGSSLKNREMLAPVAEIFQKLMGKTDLQYKQFRELLGKLAPEELKGVFLGDFLLGKPIGHGAHGIVHKGIHLSTGRQVAIKLLRDNISDNKEIQNRFKQEAELLSRFNSPHIVKILGYADAIWQAPKDISLKDEQWYKDFKKGGKQKALKTFIAMEWVEGQTLDEVYASTGSAQVTSTDSVQLASKNSAQHNIPIDFPKITQWFIDACTAIEQVHQMDYIHRDIKPSNLMIDKDGTLKLMDFGIARALQSNSPQITQDLRDMLGTPAYMAPEQIRLLDAEAEVGKGADIYGLSAVFYELYTQQRLFNHNKETVQTIKKIKKKGTQRPLPPIDCNKKIPWALDIILKGGLENEVTDRYRSIAQLKRDLVHYQKDEAIEYRKPTVLRRSGLWYRRNRKVVNIVGASLLVLMISTGFYLENLKYQRNLAEEAKVLAEESAKAEKKAKVKTQQQLVEANHNFGLTMNKQAKEALNNQEYNKAILYSQYALKNLKKNNNNHSSIALGRVSSINSSPLIFSTPVYSQLSGDIKSMKYSPDGKILAVGTGSLFTGSSGENYEGVVILWDVYSGKRLKVLSGYMGNIFSLAFSPDSKNIATGSSDSFIKIWDIEKEKSISISHIWSKDHSLVYSPSGNKVALIVYDKDGKSAGEIRSSKTGKLLYKFKADNISFLQKDIIIVENDSIVDFYNPKSGKKIIPNKIKNFLDMKKQYESKNSSKKFEDDFFKKKFDWYNLHAIHPNGKHVAIVRKNSNMDNDSVTSIIIIWDIKNKKY